MILTARPCDAASVTWLDNAYKSCAPAARLLYHDVVLSWRIANRAGGEREAQRCMTQRKGQEMTGPFIFSFTEPVSPEALRTLFEQTSWADNRSPLDIQLMLDRSHFTLGVWDEDRLIGFSRVITDDRYRALIDDVVVDSAYRGQGIASQMLDKMLKRLQHVEIIMLDCATELESFYGQFGFKAKGGSSLELRNTG